MKQTLNISGMTCEACEYKINYLFSQVAGVKSVMPHHASNMVEIETDAILTKVQIQDVLKPHTKYAYIENAVALNSVSDVPEVVGNQYYPLFLIAAFITIVSALKAFHLNIYTWQHFEVNMFLHNFMTGFFLVFSFFKLLNVKAFAESFQMYDLLAAKLPVYGKLYPFIELALGLLCLVHFQERLVYIADIIIMGFGALGVIQSVVDKRKIRCACLGTVFNLPMSTVTIVENSLMVIVGLVLLIW
jgi:copper chaperone CopZ